METWYKEKPNWAQYCEVDSDGVCWYVSKDRSVRMEAEDYNKNKDKKIKKLIKIPMDIFMELQASAMKNRRSLTQEIIHALDVYTAQERNK